MHFCLVFFGFKTPVFLAFFKKVFDFFIKQNKFQLWVQGRAAQGARWWGPCWGVFMNRGLLLLFSLAPSIPPQHHPMLRFMTLMFPNRLDLNLSYDRSEVSPYFIQLAKI